SGPGGRRGQGGGRGGPAEGAGAARAGSLGAWKVRSWALSRGRGANRPLDTQVRDAVGRVQQPQRDSLGLAAAAQPLQEFADRFPAALKLLQKIQPELVREGVQGLLLGGPPAVQARGETGPEKTPLLPRLGRT